MVRLAHHKIATQRGIFIWFDEILPWWFCVLWIARHISSEPFLRRGAGCCQPRIGMSWVDNEAPEERVRIPLGIRTGEEGVCLASYYCRVF